MSGIVLSIGKKKKSTAIIDFSSFSSDADGFLKELSQDFISLDWLNRPPSVSFFSDLF